MSNLELRNSLKYFIDQYFQEVEEVPLGEVVKIADSNQIEKLRKINIPNEGRNVEEVMEEMMKDIYDYRGRADHPRFFGFIPGPVCLNSWIGDVMTSAYNLHAGSWLVTSAGSCVEKSLINWLSEKVGYDTNKSSGLFVSGGSMANLTALVAARDSKLSFETLPLGTAYVSDQTHSSVKKALKIAGISPKNIRKISVDSNYKMNIDELEKAINDDISKGLKPFVIIASAGTTNTGSIDPIPEISNICSQYGLWMHVDGAFGASILLSKNYNHLLKGIENADSLSWDAHKWLFQTYSCAMVLIKNKNNLAQSFSENPEYLRDLDVNDGEVNYGNIGIELTRPARGLKFWFTLQTVGTDELSRRIEYGIHLAEYAKEVVTGLNNWEIISEPQSAIINFRYAPTGIPEQEINDLNSGISHLALQDNYAGVFTTVLDNKVVLRMCCINPETTQDDIEQTITKLDKFAQHLLNNNISGSAV
ncbi:aminotransferase class I/II-fold pyridoxal phosphate-dependent enzyme (plasmid) [Paraclostridium ghonii]|uniref:pyridoxal phosphate-dependent decarboxylase family protein n=1 Tax=Paraclostridium ghonii TaxID=29358 RepID=UPI00202CB469|nr:aminotransferase class I/II-fold pyridoxal phosphate-dependent enzyme [Paeniclostridium ghonii]MCM0165094.1 aminotransferase class I/II-fold pyridoxal phosphate-dependent enzyme [Paeniclostridium ghonii]